MTVLEVAFLAVAAVYVGLLAVRGRVRRRRYVGLCRDLLWSAGRCELPDGHEGLHTNAEFRYKHPGREGWEAW